MDYHTLPRRELQFLCKKYGIPANTTNVQMATSLSALLNDPSSQVLEGTCAATPLAAKKQDVESLSVARRTQRTARRPDPVTPLVTTIGDTMNSFGSNVIMTRSRTSAIRQKLIPESSISKTDITSTDTTSRTVGRNARTASVRKGKSILKAIEAESVVSELSSLTELSTNSGPIEVSSVSILPREQKVSTAQGNANYISFLEVPKVTESTSEVTDDASVQIGAVVNTPKSLSSGSTSEVNVKEAHCETILAGATPRYLNRARKVIAADSELADSNNSASIFSGLPNFGDSEADSNQARQTANTRRSGRRVTVNISQNLSSNLLETVGEVGESETNGANKDKPSKKKGTVTFSDAVEVNITEPDVYEEEVSFNAIDVGEQSPATKTFAEEVECDADNQSNEISTDTSGEEIFDCIQSQGGYIDCDVSEPLEKYSGIQMTASSCTVEFITDTMETLTLRNEIQSCGQRSGHNVADVTEEDNCIRPSSDQKDHYMYGPEVGKQESLLENSLLHSHIEKHRGEEQESSSINENLLEKLDCDGNLKDFIRDTIVSLAEKVVSSCSDRDKVIDDLHVSNVKNCSSENPVRLDVKYGGSDSDRGVITDDLYGADTTHVKICSSQNLVPFDVKDRGNEIQQSLSDSRNDIENTDLTDSLYFSELTDDTDRQQSSVIPTVDSSSGGKDQCLIVKIDDAAKFGGHGITCDGSFTLEPAQGDEDNQNASAQCEPVYDDASALVKGVEGTVNLSELWDEATEGAVSTDTESRDGEVSDLDDTLKADGTAPKSDDTKNSDPHLDDTKNAVTSLCFDTDAAGRSDQGTFALKAENVLEFLERDGSTFVEANICTRAMIQSESERREESGEPSMAEGLGQAKEAVVECKQQLREESLAVRTDACMAVKNIDSILLNDQPKMDSLTDGSRNSTEEPAELTSMSLRKLKGMLKKPPKNNAPDVSNGEILSRQLPNTTKASVSMTSTVGKKQSAAKAGNNTPVQPRTARTLHPYTVGKKPRMMLFSGKASHALIQAQESPATAKKRQALKALPSNVRKTISGSGTQTAKAILHETLGALTPTPTAKLSMDDTENLQSPCGHGNSEKGSTLASSAY